MFRWTLRQTMDRYGVTRYALQKEADIAMNTVRAMYDGKPTRIDFPVVERVIHALRRLTKQPLTAADVFTWEEGEK
ncbi:helix-turn-helix domain-containing protein [Deinococcus peraridilitoris]|nr:helix-turn-helix transcriptional regulator [Deinococcus peraridilitoris]